MNSNTSKTTATSRSTLVEGLNHMDLVGIMKPTIHIDEFSSKMGEDADIVVASFFVRDRQAALDLVSWFEKGYEFVLDADMSPGEIKPGRYLVYIELKRRSSTARNLDLILSDLNSITEFTNSSDWNMRYQQKVTPWSVETYLKSVPISPLEYKRATEIKLNGLRAASGLPVKSVYSPDADLKKIQQAAGIK